MLWMECTQNRVISGWVYFLAFVNNIFQNYLIDRYLFTQIWLEYIHFSGWHGRAEWIYWCLPGMYIKQSDVYWVIGLGCHSLVSEMMDCRYDWIHLLTSQVLVPYVYMYTWGLDLVTTIPADVLAPEGLSKDTVLITPHQFQTRTNKFG